MHPEIIYTTEKEWQKVVPPGHDYSRQEAEWDKHLREKHKIEDDKYVEVFLDKDDNPDVFCHGKKGKFNKEDVTDELIATILLTEGKELLRKVITIKDWEKIGI